MAEKGAMEVVVKAVVEIQELREIVEPLILDVPSGVAQAANRLG